MLSREAASRLRYTIGSRGRCGSEPDDRAGACRPGDAARPARKLLEDTSRICEPVNNAPMIFRSKVEPRIGQALSAIGWPDSPRQADRSEQPRIITEVVDQLPDTRTATDPSS